MGAIGYKTGGDDGESGSFYEPGMGGGLESTKEETPSAPESQNRVAGERLEYSTATDSFTVHKAVSATVGAAQPTESSDPLDHAILNGSVIGRDQLTPDAVVESPLIGGSMRLRDMLNLGWARKTADGYQFLGVDGNFKAEPTAAPKADVPKPEADADQVSLDGVQPTSVTNDIVHRQLKDAAGPATYQAIVSAAILGTDLTPHIADVARSSGQPVEHVRQSVEGVMGEYARAARQVFQANGGRSGEGFEAMLAWAQTEGKQDQAIDALQSLVEDHDPTQLAKLSRQYSRLNRLDFSTNEVLGADLGPNVRVFKGQDNEAWVEIKGREPMQFRRAVAAGLLKLSGGGR